MTNFKLLKTAESRHVHKIFPSPNIEPRLNNLHPKFIILHYTGLETFKRSLEILSRPDCKVSCHYVVDVDGQIVQMVSEDMRAWHAGVSCWKGETDINSLSIGIEIQNPGHSLGYPDFPLEQINAVIALCRDIMSRHTMQVQDVLAHSDVAPSRKIDPGEKFDWERLASEGIGLWVSSAPLDTVDIKTGDDFSALERINEIRSLLSQIGYCVQSSGALNEELSFVLRAFQLHFRQELINSHPDFSTLVTLRKLIEAQRGFESV
ncbi:MAG: N-acetylmuramoyl-L-alanine amidase [Hyphomicrobium sp.]